MRLTVIIRPNANESKFQGWKSKNTVSFCIKSPAIKNKANEELIRFISKSAKIPKNSINIIKGSRSRNKILDIRDSSFDSFINTFKDSY